MNSSDATRVLIITAVDPRASSGGSAATRSLIELFETDPIRAQVSILNLRGASTGQRDRLRRLVALGRSLGSSLPSKSLFACRRRGVVWARAALGQDDHEIVVINSGELFFLAEHAPRHTLLLGVAHNDESKLYAQQTRRLREVPLVGSLFRADLRKLQRVENRGLRRLDGLLCLSAKDAAGFRARASDLPILSLPTAFAYPPYARASRSVRDGPVRLGFLAKYGWWPNTEAVEWFLREVLPHVSPGRIQLLLFGQGAERFAGRHPALVARGFVPELTSVWEESDVVICPMRSGSGINIKFVEAVYNRMPILATPYTKRGLPEFDDPAIKYLDTADDWRDFLNSDDLEAFASRAPRPETSALFSLPAAASRLADFVAELRHLRRDGAVR